MHLPTFDMLVSLHDQALHVGGSDGLRDAAALESALNSVKTALGYTDLSIPDAAGTLAWRLTKAHAFADGNKRTASLAFHLTLSLNGWSYTGSPETLASVIIHGAAATGGYPTFFSSLLKNCEPNPTLTLLMDYDLDRWSPELPT